MSQSFSVILENIEKCNTLVGPCPEIREKSCLQGAGKQVHTVITQTAANNALFVAHLKTN